MFSSFCVYITVDFAELSSMAAELAVGKLGDTFSSTDSALGKSSVITSTTAGATQFSEVSYIIDINA